jgi:tRNA pseudouridine55 synthase
MPPRLDGLLVLDKPAGLTSRAALDRALKSFPRGTRMGHTGTLDPLATGVLVLCLGSATRLAEYVQRMAKTYRTTVYLGARSDTDDGDGTVVAVEGAIAPDLATVTAHVAEFVGEHDQVPPAFSAAKIAGRRAYDLARGGGDVVLTARRVCIHGIDVLRYAYPELDLEVRCGKGTYIRSLARDLGEGFGCGGYVQALRRTRVGPFAVKDAATLDADVATVRSRLLPAEAALAELPRVTLSAAEARILTQGREVDSVPVALGKTGDAPFEVAVFDDTGRLAAVGSYDARRRRLRPEKVL